MAELEVADKSREDSVRIVVPKCPQTEIGRDNNGFLPKQSLIEQGKQR